MSLKILKLNLHHYKSLPLKWRIQDFSDRWGRGQPIILAIFFAENCMKLENFGPSALTVPLHPPMF